MKMNRYKIVTAVVSAMVTFLMTGCQAESNPFLSPEQLDGVGSIAIRVTADGNMQTRAAKPLTDEQKNQYLVSIRQGNTYHVLSKVLNKLTAEDLAVPAGYGYIVTAESCSEHDAETMPNAFGQPRLVGSSEPFAVAKGETSTANVLCTPANAGVTVIEDETFTDVFSAYEMTVRAGSRELTFTSGNTSAIGYYNLSGDGLTLSYQLGAVRIENGETVTLSSTVNLQKGRITQLTLRSTPKGTITLSIIYDDTFLREDIEMIIDPEADRLETDAEQETDTQL